MFSRGVGRLRVGVLAVACGALAAALVVLLMIGIPYSSSPTPSDLVVWIAPGASIDQIVKIKHATYSVPGTRGCAFWNPNTVVLSARELLSVSEWFELKAQSKASSFRCQIASMSDVTGSIRTIEAVGGV